MVVVALRDAADASYLSVSGGREERRRAGVREGREGREGRRYIQYTVCVH